VPKNQIEVVWYYKVAADQNDISSQFNYAEPLSTFWVQTVTHWMVHWCGIAHDHAEIDTATWDAATTNNNRIGSTTDMMQQRIELDQQQTCGNNEQNRINDRHVAATNRHSATTNRRTEPDQQQTCQNNEQKRINNRHAATTNKIRSTTNIREQRTKPNQRQTCGSN
jgi:hypothetical protein